ncbi:MAG: methionine--tRNA ligase [Coriobacteriales bacterium]|nr:methionine--tRNA ligase [Coriobacteriales bacterium]
MEDTCRKYESEADKGSFYITTPIYYVNATPHLGTAYTTMATDTMARWQRMDGKDTRFLTGLDEHGQKVAQSAAAAGISPQEWCDRIAPKFKEAWKALSISNDDFIRTTDERHMRGVQAFWNALYEKGFIYKDTYDGWYCVPEETFFTAEQIVKKEDGTVVCPDCGRPLEFVHEENWFFKLSEFGDKLLAYYDEHPDFICPTTRRNEVISFVKSGLKDLSISRTTFDWGVPLPFDQGHVTYVWIDALLNYITAIGYGSDDPADQEMFAKYWPCDIHYVGKDIIRFHCVIWPAMLMAAGLPCPKKVFAHGFLLTKGEKMSKSKGNAVAPADLTAIFGVDAYRYYFLSDVQFGADGAISMDRMAQVYNSDLANQWGNLVSRVFNMCGKYFDGKVPEFPANQADAPNPLRDIAAGLYDRYKACMDVVDYSGAVAAVGELCSAANHYVEDSAPWNLAKSEETRDQLAAVIYNALEAIRIMALFYAPFMPNTSAEVFRRLSLEGAQETRRIQHCSKWGKLAAGNAVTKGAPLFPRLDAKVLTLADK